MTAAMCSGVTEFCQARDQSCMSREIIIKSGNEVYYTNHLVLLVNDMLCGKLDCNKVLN